MLSAKAQGKKRALDEAFSVSAPDAGDSHRNRRVKGASGKEAYRVDVQTITVKKKKITYLDTTSIEPPAGYAYLPVGYRVIKEFCRNDCLRRGKLYYVVSDIPKATGKFNNMISEQVGRIGWHFPQKLVTWVLENLGASDAKGAFNLRNPLLIKQPPPKEVVTIENLYDLFKDLFPEMPDKSISLCAIHAFFEDNPNGTRRVGKAMDASWAHKVQLAVNAHIRHVYTDYDKLIKIVGWQRARLRVERPAVMMLIKWRGEDGEYEIEEQQQEVVIIDDSESEEDQDDDDGDDSSNSDLEIVGSRSLWYGRDELVLGTVPDIFLPRLDSVARPPPSALPEWPRSVRLLAPLDEVPDRMCDLNGNMVLFDPLTQTIRPAEGQHVDRPSLARDGGREIHPWNNWPPSSVGDYVEIR